MYFYVGLAITICQLVKFQMRMQEIVLYARLVSKEEETGVFELEYGPGTKVTLTREDFESIEEYIDPVTGIPVAKIVFSEGQRSKVFQRATIYPGMGTGPVPFTMGGGAPTFLPQMQNPQQFPGDVVPLRWKLFNTCSWLWHPFFGPVCYDTYGDVRNDPSPPPSPK